MAQTRKAPPTPLAQSPDPSTAPEPGPGYGRVIEVRDDTLTIREGVSPIEVTYPVTPGHGATPGSMVRIYKDGSVEFAGAAPAAPENVPVPQKPD